MIPIKPLETGSRGSSILKVPKQRLPFQHIVNPPSPLPETTVPNSKRRVSFAEKKHVKEFCDSFEQGTVWDSTYEETDSSGHKTTRSVNDGSSTFNVLQQSSAVSLDKENQSLNLCVYQEQREINVYSEITPNVDIENKASGSSPMESDADVPNVLINSSAMTESRETIISKKRVSLVSSSQVVLQETIYTNDTMTFTKCLSNVPQNDKENICVQPEERADETIHDVSMDFTEAVPNRVYLDEEHLDNTQIDMELTMEPEMQNESEEQTLLNEMSMEMTTAIPSISLEIPNSSMEMTTRVSSNPLENAKALPSPTLRNLDLSMEMTSAVSSLPIAGRNIYHKGRQDDERTKMFRNSMEFTTAVPSSLQNQDMEMEFTRPVSNILSTQNFTNRRQSTAANRTILSQNEGMEFTDVIERNVQHKTILAHNDSMEFTNVIERNLEQDTEIIPSKDNSTNSMELTSPLTSDEGFNASSVINLTSKRRKLSSSSTELQETITNLENEVHFANCGITNVSLRRSDGVNVLNTELTAPILRDYSQNHLPVGIHNQDNNTVNITSNFNVFQMCKDNTSACDLSISQIAVPPLSQSFSFLDQSRTIHTKNFNLKENQDVNSRSKMNVNCSLDGSKQLLNFSKIEGANNIANESDEPVILNVSSTSSENLNSCKPFFSGSETEKESDSNEITVPIVRNSHLEQNSLPIETFNQHNNTAITSKILEIYKEVPVIGETSISQVCVPSVSPGCSFLDQSDPKRTESFNLYLEDNRTVNSRSKININCSLENDKEPFNISHNESKNNVTENESDEHVTLNVSSTSFEDLDKSKDKEDDFLLEYEEPPSAFFNVSNSIEKPAQNIYNSEIDCSKTLSSTERKRPCEEAGICEYRNSIEENEKLEEISEISESRSMFVVGNEIVTQSESPILLRDGVKGIQSTSQMVLTKLNSVNNLFESAIKSVKKMRMHEKNTNVKHKRARVLNKNPIATETTDGEPFAKKCANTSREKDFFSDTSSTKENSGSTSERLQCKNVPKKSVSCKSRETGVSLINVNNCPLSNSESEEKNQNNIMNKEVNNCDVNRIQEEQGDLSVVKDPFYLLLDNIKSYVQRSDCIWSIRCLQKNMLAFDYISKSLVIIIETTEPNDITFRDIKNIRIKSLIPDTSEDLMRMVHNLIIQKVRPELLLEAYKLYDDVLPLLQNITEEVKIALNFMYDLKKLEHLHLMEISTKRISFVTRTKRMSIILKVELNIKPFDEIGVDDIEVSCILGSISESVVKQLIKNVKKDFKFLRRFINDVRDYVEIMEESAALSSKTRR